MGFVIPVTTPIGTNIVAASLPAGQIAAVKIDNPSGSWLYLPSLRESVAPYTLGWSRVFDVNAASFDVQFAATGPDGTASVMLGDPIRLTMYDAETAAAAGISTTPGSLFVPIPRKRVVTTVLGVNLGATGFTGADAGRLIAGVIIDNPSGAWLALVAGGITYYIAPYTLRWVKRIDPPILVITSLSYAAAGPAGQVSALASGDAATLTLLDIPPDASDTAFIEHFTTISKVTINIVGTRLNATLGVLIPAVAGKRIRLLAVQVASNLPNTFGGSPIGPISASESRAILYVSENGGVAGGLAILSPVQYWVPDRVEWNVGLDVALSTSVVYSLECLFHDVSVQLNASYQMI